VPCCVDSCRFSKDRDCGEQEVETRCGVEIDALPSCQITRYAISTYFTSLPQIKPA